MVPRTPLYVRLLAFMLFCQTILEASAEVLTVDANTRQVVLTPHLQILQDPGSTWDENQADSAFDNGDPFIFDGVTPNFGITASTYWFALDISSELDTPSTWLLEIEYPLMDEVSFAYQSETGEWVRKVAGDLIPFDSRDIAYPTLVFRLPLEALETKRVLISVNTQGSVQMPAKLWHPDAFADNSKTDYALLGAYYGIMLAMVLYNLFIYFSVRDPSYIYYIAYVVFISMYNFANRGLAVQYLWPDNPAIGTFSVTVSAYVAATFGLLFCKSYLHISEHAPRLNRLVSFAIATTLITILLPFLISYSAATTLGSINAVFVAFLILYCGFWMTLQGQRAARYFFAAWMVFLIAVILIALQRLGAIEGNFVIEEGVHIGTAIEVVLLSLGLADRINTLRREKAAVQQELVQRNLETIDALQHASKMKDEFVANVSHELRTPLTGIIGLSEIVLDQNSTTLDGNSRKNLNLIRSSGQRLTSLVNDIIDISAINQNHLEVELHPVDLKSTAEFVLVMCKPMLGNKPVELISDIPEETPLVLADENRIIQVFFNLVANAIKFTSQGTVEVSAVLQGQKILVEVTDTGIGIAPELHTEIFEPFKQVDGAIDREVGGTGLGLSITKKIIELHDSSITVRSDVGEGTTFGFSLAVSDEQTITRPTEKTTIEYDLPATETESPLLHAQNQVNDKTVLVVDDEYANLHVLQEFLKPQCNVLTAQDGFAALDELKSNLPDLLIVDLMMPGMSGYELCQKVRETYSAADLPILILTAKSQTEDLIEGLKAGANDYLSKPFHREELIARAQKQLQLKDLIEIRGANIKLEEQVGRFRESEQRLHTSQQRLARMLDYGEENLLCIDAGGQIVHATKNAARFLRSEPDALEGRPIEVVLSDEDDSNLRFPFDDAYVSDGDAPQFYPFTLRKFDNDRTRFTASVCIVTLTLEQEFYIVILHEADTEASQPEATMLIAEVNKNSFRSQVLGTILSQITPAVLKSEPALVSELQQIDLIIDKLSASVSFDARDQEFRANLVDLMQDCINVWEKYTQRTVIDLAEESRIWRVNIDNGRLRARSMERYLDQTKLPKNPRWREVTRTAYFLLGHLELGKDDKEHLEQQIKRLDQFARS